ncbi:MAG: PAS domain S-box protein [Desulfobacteraceae bacterium]|nr:PAS domain S-box protein [Desulfobacteraceae bacterium]
MTKKQDQKFSERYKKLYEMLLEAIPSSILLISPDMRIISANQNFLQKSRRTLSATIGCRVDEIFPDVILDHMKIMNQIRRVFKENHPSTGQKMFYRAPGVTKRTYYYRLLPFSWEGQVEYVILLMEDVTEQIRLSEEVRRVEMRLASIFESASDMILSTDTQGRLLSWNPAAENISGYTFEDVEGRFFSDVFKTDHQKEIEYVFAGLKTGTRSQMGEWQLITRQGENVPVSWVCSPMKDENADTIGIVAVGRDLTERRKLEMQLLQSQKFAALGVMAGGIAHEIRNPLAICSSAAQFLMEEDIEKSFRKECAKKIHAGIQRASVIIENLLRFARPCPKSNTGELNLCSLVRETVSLISNQARIQKATIDVDVGEEYVTVNGNAGLLQQVLINLFLNGIEAMPDGGTLGISVEINGGQAVIRVSDTGHGMSKTDMEKIFDPFFTTSPVGKGTGLGLSISYSIIQQHSGGIEVDSKPGKGSTFVVKLPVSGL